MKTEEDPGDGKKKQFISEFLTELKKFEESEAPGSEHSAVEGLLSLGAAPSFHLAPPPPPVPSSFPEELPDINDADIKHLLGASEAELGRLEGLDEEREGEQREVEQREGEQRRRPQSWPSPGHLPSPSKDLRSASLPSLHELLASSSLSVPAGPVPPSPSSFNPASLAPSPSTISMLGQAISLVQSKELPPGNFVRTSDIFDKFFSKRHWDEFKTILEKNGVLPLVVVEEGNVEVEVMRVTEVEALLMRNEARKEGFVRCRTLDSHSSLFADSVIQATQERPPFQLSSGIKTRHGDHSDIVYVKLEGRTLPAVVINEEEWVRLADVQAKIFQSEPQGNRTEMERIRRACFRLGMGVEKIPPSVKWRLVAQAASARSNSLHVIPTRLLPLLVAALRNSSRKRPEEDLGGDLSEYEELDEEEEMEAELGGGGEGGGGGGERAALSPSPPPVAVPSWNAEHRELQPAAMFLSAREVAPELQALLRPCRVVLPKAPVLKVAVCSPKANQPSVFGNYHDHLFLYPAAPCVECTVCAAMFSIPVFLRHHHAAWFDHQAPKLHMYLPGFSHCPPRFDLWARLDRKLRDFGMLEHAFTFPDHLVEYYRKRWAKEIGAPPASKLKSAAGGARTNRRPSRAVSASDRLAKARPDSPLDLDKLIDDAAAKVMRRARRVVEPLEGRLTCAVKVPKVASLDSMYERTMGSLAPDWAALARFPVGLSCPEKDAILARLYGLPP